MAVNIEDFRAAVEEEPAFPVAEYERRVAVAREAMSSADIDALVLFDPQNVCYFTGYTSVNLWDTSAVVIRRAGNVRVALWEFEVPRLEASAALGDSVTYGSHADPLDAVVTAIGRDVKRYGTDSWTRGIAPAASQRLRRLIDAEPADGREILRQCRLQKSYVELEKLRASARVTDAGVAAAAGAAIPGATDRDIAAAAASAMIAAGAGHFSIQPIVAVGARAGVAHSESSGRGISSGEGVFLELGAPIDRYTAPVMRTVAVGEPNPELEQLADVAAAATEATVAALAPGRTCAEIAEVAHEAIAEAGPDVLFHGYVGYPIGISFPPSWLEDLSFYIHRDNHAPVKENMTFHIPISLRLKGRRGVGLSYSVLVTREGAEILTGTQAQLIHV